MGTAEIKKAHKVFFIVASRQDTIGFFFTCKSVKHSVQIIYYLALMDLAVQVRLDSISNFGKKVLACA